MKRECKILLLSPLPPPVGGIATWSVNLLQFANDSGQDNIVHLNTALKFRSITQNHIGYRIFSSLFDSFRIILLFIFYCLKYKPTIAHITSSASLSLFRDKIIGIISKLFGIQYIFHFRFGRIPELMKKQNWEWKMLVHLVKKSTSTIVIDSPSFETLRANKLDNVVLISNPCSTELEQIAHQETITYLTNELIFVGHIIPDKGIFEMIDAIVNTEQNITLTMIGPVEGKIKTKLIELASKKDNGDWLRLVGVKSKTDVLEKMQQSYALLLPSYSEGFPNVVLEAMSCGCPVIGTNVGAIPEMLDIKTENSCGLCVEPHDVNALRIAIELLINNPSRRQIMSKNGKLKVLNNYTMGHIFKEYQKLWSNKTQDNQYN
jgi:glycosyltransferase involved in cell wall biosynthesis